MVTALLQAVPYTPWFSGYTTTINAGTATAIGKATEVAAQNIAATSRTRFSVVS
jgi:hypothetical protein